MAVSIENELGALRFIRRQASWVAVTHSRFYKIVRKSDDPFADLRDDRCIASAQREYQQAWFLHRLDDATLAPERIDRGCLVYPFITGPDLIDYIRQSPDDNAVASALTSAASVLARFHTRCPADASIKQRDFDARSFAIFDETTLLRLQNRPRSLTILGFEVRNFRYDEAVGAWRFFDPHHLAMGCPEEDLARLVISLLMMGWGRSWRCFIWTRFDLSVLLETYSRNSCYAIDPKIFKQYLYDVARMRRYYAERAVIQMGATKKKLGQAYCALFFWQIDNWIGRHTNGL